MKSIFVVIDDGRRIDSYHETLKEAKEACYGECLVFEVVDIIEADYVLKYTKKNLSKKL